MRRAVARVALCASVLATGAGLAAAQECPIVLPEPALEAKAAPAAPGERVMRIVAIDFVGNEAFGDARLRRQMEMKPHRFWRPAARSVFTEARWHEDHRRLCRFYRDQGYATAHAGPPELREAARPPRAGERVRGVALRVPVREGPRYRLGQLSIEGVFFFTSEEAREMFDIEPGQPYRHARVEEGYQNLREAYGRRGFAAWSATIALQPDPARGVLNVAVKVEEGGRHFVGRIAFTGHEGTLDQTLRREVLLSEGDLLDTERLRESVRRINGLGYATVKDVRLIPSVRSPEALDVTFVVEERSPLRYSLVAGRSGLEGLSVTGAVGTVNLLGRGERFLASAQLGEEVRVFELGLSRPYLLGSPWTVGVQLQQPRLELPAVAGGGIPAHTRDETVGRLQLQRAVARRMLVWGGYSLGTVTLIAEEEPTPPGFGRRHESALFSATLYDGWDHFWKPLRGLRATASLQLAGGPLGGTRDDAKARARVFGFVPLTRGTAIGLGGEAGWLRDFGAEGLPFDERYLLGGETQLRGFDVRTVGPRDAGGRLLGGTRFLVLQAEQHVDLARWLRALAFVDAGQAWAEGEPIRLGRLRVSTGLELRLPVFGLPVRLVYAVNPARDDFHPRSSFRVVVGPLW